MGATNARCASRARPRRADLTNLSPPWARPTQDVRLERAQGGWEDAGSGGWFFDLGDELVDRTDQALHEVGQDHGLLGPK